IPSGIVSAQSAYALTRRYGEEELTMDYIRLGSGLYVSRLALGTIPFGSGGGFERIAGLGPDDARRQLREALDRGVNFIDTANLYSAGDAEKVLGEIMGSRRDDIVLTSRSEEHTSELQSR